MFPRQEHKHRRGAAHDPAPHAATRHAHRPSSEPAPPPPAPAPKKSIFVEDFESNSVDSISVVVEHDEFHVVTASGSGAFVWAEPPPSMAGVDPWESHNAAAQIAARSPAKLKKTPAALERIRAATRTAEGPPLSEAERYRNQVTLYRPSTPTSAIRGQSQPSTPRKDAARGMRVDTSRGIKPYQPPELSPTSWWKRFNFGSPPPSPTAERPPPRSRAASLSMPAPPAASSSRRHRAESNAVVPSQATASAAAPPTRPTGADHYAERKKIRDETHAKRMEIEAAYAPAHPPPDHDRLAGTGALHRGAHARGVPHGGRAEQPPDERARAGRLARTHIRTQSEPQPLPRQGQGAHAQAVPSSSRNRLDPPHAGASSSARGDPPAAVERSRPAKESSRRRPSYPQSDTRELPRPSHHPTHHHTRNTSDPLVAPTPPPTSLSHAPTRPHTHIHTSPTANPPPTHAHTPHALVHTPVPPPTHTHTHTPPRTHIRTRSPLSTPHLPPDSHHHPHDKTRSRKPSEASVPARTMSTIAEAGSYMSRARSPLPPPLVAEARRRAGR